MYLHPSSPSVRCFNERNKHRPPLYLFCQWATKTIQSIKIRYKKGKSTTNIQASPLPPLVSSHHPGNSTHTHTPHTPRTPMLLAPSPFRYGISVSQYPRSGIVLTASPPQPHMPKSRSSGPSLPHFQPTSRRHYCYQQSTSHCRSQNHHSSSPWESPKSSCSFLEQSPPSWP